MCLKCKCQAGADKSYCPTPGGSAFSDRASEISLGTCPWASDISMSCIDSESSFSYEFSYSHENALLNDSESQTRKRLIYS